MSFRSVFNVCSRVPFGKLGDLSRVLTKDDRRHVLSESTRSSKTWLKINSTVRQLFSSNSTHCPVSSNRSLAVSVTFVQHYPSLFQSGTTYRTLIIDWFKMANEQEKNHVTFVQLIECHACLYNIIWSYTTRCKRKSVEWRFRKNTWL